MEIADTYVAFMESILKWSTMSHSMAHLHLGLLIYVGVQVVLRTRRASSIALQAVYGAEIVNEILQRAHYGSWRMEDTVADIVLTVLWPTTLYAVAKYRRARWEMRMVKRQLAKERQRTAPALALVSDRPAAPVPQHKVMG